MAGKDKRYEANEKLGLCTWCGLLPRKEGSKLCEEHSAVNVQSMTESRKRQRKRVRSRPDIQLRRKNLQARLEEMIARQKEYSNTSGPEYLLDDVNTMIAQLTFALDQYEWVLGLNDLDP